MTALQLELAFTESKSPPVDFYPDFLTIDEADRLLAASLQLEWTQNEIKMFGKPILNPRLEAIYGDRGCDYSYSGVDLSVLPWADCLLDLRAKVQALTGHQFHIAIGNRYRTGKDSIGWHSDKQKSMGSNPAIASISLGATRRFSIKPRNGGDTHHFDLGHGSLVLMHPGCQSTHVHQVPKQLRITNERINWTFRPHINGEVTP